MNEPLPWEQNTCTRDTGQVDKNGHHILCGNPCNLKGGWCEDCKEKHYKKTKTNGKPKLTISEIQNRLKQFAEDAKHRDNDGRLFPSDSL